LNPVKLEDCSTTSFKILIDELSPKNIFKGEESLSGFKYIIKFVSLEITPEYN